MVGEALKILSWRLAAIAVIFTAVFNLTGKRYLDLFTEINCKILFCTHILCSPKNAVGIRRGLTRLPAYSAAFLLTPMSNSHAITCLQFDHSDNKFCAVAVNELSDPRLSGADTDAGPVYPFAFGSVSVEVIFEPTVSGSVRFG